MDIQLSKPGCTALANDPGSVHKEATPQWGSHSGVRNTN